MNSKILGSEFQGNFVFRIFLKINDQLFWRGRFQEMTFPAPQEAWKQ